MRNRLRIFGIIPLICMVASCSKVPNHIISERKMRVVMYDMQLAEAMVETLPQSYPNSNEKQTVYDGVFTKHRITQAEYDSSLIWYGKHMDLYMGVYRLVQKDINASIALLDNIRPNAISGDFSDSDSIDIWIYRRSKRFSAVHAFNGLTFDIAPEKPYPSGSSYVFQLSVWGLPPVLKNKLKVHVSAIQADTIVSANKEITGNGYYEAVVHTIDSLDVKRIYGYVFMNETDAAFHPVYLNNLRLMKFKNE